MRGAELNESLLMFVLLVSGSTANLFEIALMPIVFYGGNVVASLYIFSSFLSICSDQHQKTSPTWSH